MSKINLLIINKINMEEETKTEEEHKGGGSKENSININNALFAVVAVLVVMSAVQVFQLQGLVSAISSGNLKATAQVSGGSATGLPSQVGGCG